MLNDCIYLKFHQIVDYKYTECSTNIFKTKDAYEGDDCSVNSMSTCVWLSINMEQLLKDGEQERQAVDEQDSIIWYLNKFLPILFW